MHCLPLRHRRGPTLAYSRPLILRKHYASTIIDLMRKVVALLQGPYLRSMPETELKSDVALGVAIPSRNARGRIARLGSVIDTVLANHGYPPVIEKLLAEALTLT